MTNKLSDQEWVDLVFSIGMMAHTLPDDFKREDVANWIAVQLGAMGFPTVPMGCSWGVLTKKEFVDYKDPYHVTNTNNPVDFPKTTRVYKE
jgi:hypothetical protein